MRLKARLNMSDLQRELYLECLLLSQNCEAFCNYYFTSQGQLHADVCRRSVADFLAAYDSLRRRDPATAAGTFIADRGKEKTLTQVLPTLRRLARRQREPQDLSGWPEILMFFAILRRNLAKALGVGVPATRMTWAKGRELQSFIRWRGHFPPPIPEQMGERIRWAGETDTIAVFGDVRHSQDVMKYGASAVDFARRMGEFVGESRRMIRKYCGLFDKFTGDGFLAYFNEHLCQWHGLNYVDCFTAFLTEYVDYAQEHFEAWRRTLRKLPVEPVGLAIGADMGTVTFRDYDDHLVAVGEPIVWANRMCSEARAGEILVNNLLSEALRGRKRRELSLAPRNGLTKSGESFVATMVSIKKRPRKGGNP